MAFPVDQDRVGTNSTVSGTSHNLNLPASIAAGDMLVAIVRCPASTTIAWPAGWTEQEQSTADASDDETSIAWRVADGTEGATITITLGTSRILVGLCYRITGAAGIAFSAAAVGSASQPNSPSLSGILTAARDVLWLSIGGCDDAETLSTVPTSYTNGAVQASTATGTAGCTVYGASRQLNAVSEDPGAFALGTTSIWTAWTVALATDPFPSRLTQEPVEVAVLPTDQDARLTQLPVEVAIQSNPGLRLTQEPVEAVVQPTTQAVRLTQAPVEAVVLPAASPMRLTQYAVEVVILPEPVFAPTFQAIIID